MDKQKQIAEIKMVLDDPNIVWGEGERTERTIAEAFYEAGYRKIPEGAIILTKEEIAALNEYQKKHCTGGESLEKQVPQQQ